jgi:hypothetical protein
MFWAFPMMMLLHCLLMPEVYRVPIDKEEAYCE